MSRHTDPGATRCGHTLLGARRVGSRSYTSSARAGARSFSFQGIVGKPTTVVPPLGNEQSDASPTPSRTWRAADDDLSVLSRACQGREVSRSHFEVLTTPLTFRRVPGSSSCGRTPRFVARSDELLIGSSRPDFAPLHQVLAYPASVTRPLLRHGPHRPAWDWTSRLLQEWIVGPSFLASWDQAAERVVSPSLLYETRHLIRGRKQGTHSPPISIDSCVGSLPVVSLVPPLA
jgi:hypothetical protein